MSTQPFCIFPNARVVNNDRVFNAIFRLVDLAGRIGIDKLDGITVDHKRN